ncbi:related to methyltransferase [Fusarium mangiferae]|uniref:Related to methyltransferase n=1 Tax=Fusarium mangiferae TaxID=192010 RepID=A0A1L7UES4_FUSMA|nr:uncharacterized protein FMAN_03817 [Fusarium mangiferae]CVL06217.1 related to methyltransferase [Fusarium mangiferae]
MSSPARKKRADSGSTLSSPSPVDAESGLLPPEHWSLLPEEENAPGDEDSAVLDNASSTAFLTSSVLQYQTINGRAYQTERGNPDYWGPIDDTGQEAMDINHRVLTLFLGDKLYLAPVPEDIQTAVDIGKGTGSSRISSQMLPSLGLILHQFNLVGSHPIESYKYPVREIHLRTFRTDLLTAKLKTVPKNGPSSLTPLTTSICDGSSPASHTGSLCLRKFISASNHEPGSALSQWERFFVEGGRKIGRPFTILEENIQREGMREAGFCDIEERDFKNPVGRWPKDPKYRSGGQFMQAAFEQDAQGTVLHMDTTLGWTEEEVTVFISHFRREIRSSKIHSYFRQKVVWGRKPL